MNASDCNERRFGRKGLLIPAPTNAETMTSDGQAERRGHDDTVRFKCALEEDVQALRNCVHPAAQAMRPQFGSCPKTADLTSDDETTDLATRRAAALSAAPVAVASSKHVAPSPSHAIALARPCSHLPGKRFGGRSHFTLLLKLSEVLLFIDKQRARRPAKVL